MPFGNDLFNRNIQITRQPKKVIHLTKFDPKSEEHLLNLCKQLKNRIATYKCKVLILDNIYRHIDCCSSHRYPGVVKYQKRTNNLIRAFFGPQALNHIHFLGVIYKKVKHPHGYSTILLCDSVHMYPVYYQAMAGKLLERIVST